MAFLKKNNIPFVLFVSTEPVGKKGYMSWDEIIEIENSGIWIYWKSFSFT